MVRSSRETRRRLRDAAVAKFSARGISAARVGRIAEGHVEPASGSSPRTRRRLPIAAFAATVSLAALIASDFVASGFWLSHPVTSAVAGALAVVLLSITVIDVVLVRRAERRWRLLAQYALLELAETARAAWGVLAEVVEDDARQADEKVDPDLISLILESPDRAPALKLTIEGFIADPAKCDKLRQLLEETLGTSRRLISRWAVVMTGSSGYSELFDRHVEMIARIHGLWYFLVYGVRRGSQFRAPGGNHRDDWFVDNLVSMTQIAIRLERETWAIALSVVPPSWWDQRTDELAAPTHHSKS